MSKKKAFAVIFILFAFLLGFLGGICGTQAFDPVCIASSILGFILLLWDYYDNYQPPTR